MPRSSRSRRARRPRPTSAGAADQRLSPRGRRYRQPRTKEAAMAVITEYETDQVKQANASGKTPIVFVHGLWLLPMSWDRWRTHFEAAGFTTIAPGWPDDPNTVDEAKAHPEV